MDLNTLQEKVKKLLLRVRYPRVAGIIGLQEEVGLLARGIMEIEIYDKRERSEQLEQEVAAVLFSLVDLCNLYEINLSEACIAKLHEVEGKVNDWEKEHREELKHKRQKLD